MANPTDILLNGTSLSTAIFISENTADATVLGGLTAVDSDSLQTYTFTITADPLGAFEIVGTDLKIKAGGNALLDFDTATSHTVNVRVTDSGGGVFNTTLTINLLNEITGATGGADTISGTIGDDFVAGDGGNDSLSGLDGNDSLDGGAGDDTMAGGTGNDTFVVEDAGDIVSETVDGGTDTIEADDTYDLTDTDGGGSNGGHVENLTLTGTSDIDATGNAHDNVITGNDGINNIDGGAGDDTMIGGAGDDTFTVADTGDVVRGGADDDTVESSINYSLLDTDKDGSSADDDVEHLTLTGLATTGTGNALANELTGNALNNTLSGGAGNDTIDGGAGVDSMVGGLGDDSYIVDETTDKVLESAGSGTDAVSSSASFTLGLNVENLTLTGTSAGTTADTDAIDGTGNSLDNDIEGNDGNNVINGGTGADDMTGNNGDDTFYVDNAGDDVTEVASEGDDTVISSLNTYTLADEVENLEMISLAITGTGNDLANDIKGNNQANILSGGAGDGEDDTLAGGTGNDTYVVEGDDVVVENSNEGTDTVQTDETSYTLTEFVEHLTATGTVGTDGTGNDLNNRIDASADTGNNVLDGKAGNDTMIGGQGNDDYHVDSQFDSVVEIDNTGTNDDRVYARVDHTLSDFVERLYLTGTDSGTSADTDAINGTGNDLDNIIEGNDGNNRIDGKAGDDSMTGNDGDDTFVVDSADDTVVGGNGIDTLVSSVTRILESDNENLTLTGADEIDATGNDGANELIGNTAANRIDSGIDTTDAADTMTGGAGNDTYVVHDVLDVIETDASGTDTVESDVDFELGTSLEHLKLMGTAVSGTGNFQNNEITGNASGNRLDGQGGIDTMKGGAGSDTYVVDRAADIVDEETNTDAGDTVEASFTYSLASLDAIENLTLTGTLAANATGNTANNEITGNSAANILNGVSGDDTLTGGAGNDTYIVNDGQSATIVIDEAASEGTDTVRSTETFSLNDGTLSEVENVELTGTTDANATGNSKANRLTGNTAGNELDGGTEGTAAADTMLGGGGDDTYVIRDALDTAVEFSGGGADTIKSHILSFTLGTYHDNIELVEGSAARNATGNGTKNAMTGNSEANRLDGKAGVDTMTGLGGDDTYVVDTQTDSVEEAASGGTDLVESFASTYTLADEVENMRLMGTLGITGIGNSVANTITGNAADNLIDGKGDADSMVGGGGNDTFVVDDADDTVVGGSGTDEIRSSQTFSLADTDGAGSLGGFIEHLTLTGTTAINGTGNNLANRLTGNGMANDLNGGTGADTMIGGVGNDSYTVDNAGDVVTELAGQGTDLVTSSVTFSLDGTNAENLTLSGAGNINATGSSSANDINGNSGNNLIDGKLGADEMIGNGGTDTFVVDSLSDTVVGGAGTDTIRTGITYSLVDTDGSGTSGGLVENLTLTGGNSVNATGNGLTNRLTGNTGNNRLDGGSAADTMAGGAGNDTYIVDDAGDRVTENVSAGVDLVMSSVNIDATPGTGALFGNVENFTLTGTATNVTGNNANNVITGNASANLLSGGNGNDSLIGGVGNDTLKGGAGADNLDGGAGSDVLIFDTALGSSNVDRITSFSSGTDKIHLDDDVFTAFSATGALSAAAFVNGPLATTAAHRVIVNGADVYYDADGNGSAAAVKFATLGTGITLAATDFVIIA